MDLRLIKNVKICLRISFRIITNVVSKVATEENRSNENNIEVTITVLYGFAQRNWLLAVAVTWYGYLLYLLFDVCLINPFMGHVIHILIIDRVESVIYLNDMPNIFPDLPSNVGMWN